MIRGFIVGFGFALLVLSLALSWSDPVTRPPFGPHARMGHGW